jgi:D-alanyl-D-alanine carboxypeptidase (penicillin-binding protein 5/6)
MRYALHLLTLLLCFITSLTRAEGQPLPSDNPFPHIAAAYLLQIEHPANSSQIRTLWSGNTHRPLPPASLTKLMTALLLVESTSWRNDTPITISARAARATGSRLGLRHTEQLSAEDLLAAMLIQSANDACLALAEHHAGSERAFVAQMNQRAQQMGLSSTHFANACGFDATGHRSTAADLAHLARAVLKHPILSRLADQRSQEVTTLNTRRHLILKNKNALLGRHPDVHGIKTGFTAQAGKCLIAYAVRGNTRVLLVMLNAPNRWWDASDLIDLAFVHAKN